MLSGGKGVRKWRPFSHDFPTLKLEYGHARVYAREILYVLISESRDSFLSFVQQARLDTSLNCCAGEEFEEVGTILLPPDKLLS